VISWSDVTPFAFFATGRRLITAYFILRFNRVTKTVPRSFSVAKNCAST